MVYEPRTYRSTVDARGLVTFEVVHAETDLQVSAVRDLSREADAIVRELREEFESFLAAFPRFAESHVPIDVPAGAPAIALRMSEAARAAGVGPMAAVAGAFAEAVARELEPASPEIIVENGGDLYLIGGRDRTVLLHAGTSPLSGRFALVLSGHALPVAVCTSSGTVGPSLSYGRANAVTVVAASGALADAAASSIGNLVHGPDDVDRALQRAREIAGVLGAVVIIDDRMGVVGGGPVGSSGESFTLVPLPGR